jgi:hypothetical protein
METKKWLSASGIETLETCTWKYKCQNIDKVPQLPNDGSLRGLVAHAIFEILLNKRHKKHFDIILQKENVEASEAVHRLLIKMMKEKNIYDTLNYDIMVEMLLVGLKHDFYGEFLSGSISKPEFKFELENENPEYRVRGYIDKYVTYSNGLVIIRDFKSSKQKFSADHLKSNNQALTYSLVGYKQLKAKDVKTEFLFLRFPRQPIQEIHLTPDQLEGFEHYLSYLYSIIKNFNDETAKSNFAGANPKNAWLCQRGSWRCPYLKPFKYWALVDEKGVVARTDQNKDALKVKEGQRIVEMTYSGCPYWQNRDDGM